MKQIGDSNEAMLALLEAVLGIKNELLYIREYFHPLLKGGNLSVRRTGLRNVAYQQTDIATVQR